MSLTGTSTTGAGGWSALDITDRAAVHTLITSLRPTVIVNAASRYGDWTTCAAGAAHVALAAVDVGARLIHVSSDAVHGGRPTPYLATDPPTPVTPYGAAKAAAETAVAAIDPTAAIVRTSLLIGDTSLLLGDAGSAQTRLTLDLISGDRTGALFTDEYRRPIAVQDVAAAILELTGSDHAGLLNVAGPETLSRADLGRLIALHHGLDPSRLPTCTVADSGLAPRPADVRLDSSRAAALLKTRLRPASECITPKSL